ncbi:AAA family ATPase [Massilistercora timonensis]|uniref:cytidylate kinase-like family protein n=1 Tax=Massilistercora timonensis TaxID=2086584 RepID=UPI003AB875FB
MKKEHVSEAEAKTLMKENDRERQSYFRFWTKKDPRDRKNYDLELNTGMLSIPECADILLYTINH